MTIEERPPKKSRELPIQEGESEGGRRRRDFPNAGETEGGRKVEPIVDPPNDKPPEE